MHSDISKVDRKNEKINRKRKEKKEENSYYHFFWENKIKKERKENEKREEIIMDVVTCLKVNKILCSSTPVASFNSLMFV